MRYYIIFDRTCDTWQMLVYHQIDSRSYCTFFQTVIQFWCSHIHEKRTQRRSTIEDSAPKMTSWYGDDVIVRWTWPIEMVDQPNLTRLTRWQHFTWQHFQSKSDSRLLSYPFEHFLIKIFSKIFIQKHGTKRSLSKKSNFRCAF